jgi:hypothetical protein
MVRGKANPPDAFETTDQKATTHSPIRPKSKRAKKPLSQAKSVASQQGNAAGKIQSGSTAVAKLLSVSGAAKTLAKSFIPLITAAGLPEGLRHNQLTLYQWQKSWRWSMICAGILGLCGGVGVMAYFWLAGLPPLPNCRDITTLSPDAHRLYCAQETARSGKLEDLLAGIALVKNWSPSHPLYKDAQQSLAKWSRLVVLIARDKMNQNDFKGAMTALNQIPPVSPVYSEAQKTAAEWQQQWQKGEAISAKAAEAMKQQDWRSAFDSVTELGYLDHDYWRLQQADSLAKQILMQKESYEALKQAKKLAKKLMPDQLGEAIQLLQSVVPESDAWSESQQLLSDWSQTLVNIAMKRWQEGDTSGALQLAQQVPLDLKLPTEAADLVKLSHAYELFKDSQTESKLSWQQLWNLLEATTGVSQIQPSSPFYSEAQTKLQDWQTQLQDLQQLQFATMVADLGQKPTLNYAIDQAKQISSNHQRYSQAQTMIANWQTQIERLEDIPYLQRAQQFAASNQIPDLQLAIAQAQVIPSQRSIWSEVQTQIAVWQRQIETIEDQPLMDRAQAFAKANQLDQAIDAAAEIRPNRALYDQAQAAITTWKDKIRQALIAEDQAILDRARGFASSGQLTNGIATAAQIGPGRPLYMEAQAAIGAWLRERDGSTKTDGAAGEDTTAGQPNEATSTDSTASEPLNDATGADTSSGEASPSNSGQ